MHICCGYFFLDSQGKFLYSRSPKKQVLITFNCGRGAIAETHAGIGLLELVGGTIPAIGLAMRLVAIRVIVFTAVAALYVHWGNGFLRIKGGYEYPLCWGVVAPAILSRGGVRSRATV